MHLYRLQSDQSYTWSDGNTKTIDRRLAQTPSSAAAPTATARCHPAWLSHRALQTLRQARMQVCRWPRSWSQVLSFGKLPGPAAQMDYVPQECFEQASEFLANYQRARELLGQICEINRELLRRREAL